MLTYSFVHSEVTLTHGAPRGGTKLLYIGGEGYPSKQEEAKEKKKR